MTGHLIHLCRYLGSDFAGGKKGSQQREMARDLSKFLWLVSEGRALDLKNVASQRNIDAYVQAIRELKIGPSGIISKLNVIVAAQNFLLHG